MRKRIVLHMWEHPAGRGWPRDWPAAMEWLAQMREARPEPNPRFTELARRLTGHHPGVASPDTQDAVRAIGVPEDARGIALETARALGLSVADEEGGEVHYANGFIVDRNRDYRHRLPSNVFEDPKAPGYRLQPGGDLLPLAGMRDLACLRLETFFKRHGFVRHADEPKPEPTPEARPLRYANRAYRRPQAAGWTELQVSLLTRAQAFAMQINCDACLSDAARLTKRFIIARGGKDDGQEDATVFARMNHWMVDPQGLLGTDDGTYFVARMDDLDRALAHFTAQAEARLLPLLPAFDSAAGVDALLNAGATPTSIFFDGSYEFARQHLVAARVARNPRFEALCEMYIERAAAYRAGKRRSMFGDTVQQLRDFITFLKAN